jgi:hypothetical protein
MNQATKGAVYAAIERKVEAHLRRIYKLLDQPILDEQIKDMLKEAMDLLRQPIYH